MYLMVQGNRRLDQLTITRFVAALSVVFFHGGRELDILRHFPMLTAGPTAVGYFFVLSGFVMALACYRPGIPFDFRGYWLARFSRIYPVYILSFALTCLYYLDILSRLKPPKFLANLFLYQAWIPDFALSYNIAAWSLSVEVFFYLILPFVLIPAMRQKPRRVLWFSAGLWVLSQMTHHYLTLHSKPGMENLLAFFPPFHLNSFLIGLAGGIWYLTYAAQRPVNQTLNRIWLVAGCGLVLLLVSLRENDPAVLAGWSLDAGLLAPLFLIIVLSLALDTSPLAHGLQHPWLVMLGDASYALYILHVPIRWFFQKFLKFVGNPTTLESIFLIYLAVAIGLSVLVFNHIERPVRDWLRTHPRLLRRILLDIVLILAMIRLSFFLRLGTETSAYLRTQTLALRAGAVVFFLALLAARSYIMHSWRSLALALFFGGTALTGFMYFAWTSGWVEGFPRSIFLLMPVLIFAAIYSTRVLMEYLKPRVWNEPKLSQ